MRRFLPALTIPEIADLVSLLVLEEIDDGEAIGLPPGLYLGLRTGLDSSHKREIQACISWTTNEIFETDWLLGRRKLRSVSTRMTAEIRRHLVKSGHRFVVKRGFHSVNVPALLDSIRESAQITAASVTTPPIIAVEPPAPPLATPPPVPIARRRLGRRGWVWSSSHRRVAMLARRHPQWVAIPHRSRPTN